MKIIILGSGAALPDPARCQTSIYLSVAGKHLLFDCGDGCTRQLVKAGINPAQIDELYLTHLHHDHICDYPNFIISGWMLGRNKPLKVYGPKGVRRFSEYLLEQGAFQADFLARSHHAARQQNIVAVRPDVIEISPGSIREGADYSVDAVHVDHLPHAICECFGLSLTSATKKVVFSGDTAPCPALIALSHQADLLIHECTFPESIIAHRQAQGTGHHGHTSPIELGQLAQASEVKSLVATHFGHFDTESAVLKQAAAKHLPAAIVGPHLLDEVVEDIRRHYSGPLQLAHDLLRIDL